MARPLLGDIDLQQVQKIETEEDQVFTQHSIPALEGDFFQQGLGRRATWVKLTGVLTGAEVQDGLKRLRDKFRAAEPVDFVANITTATKVNQVIIEEMGVRELAGKPSRFEYALTLREYVSAPAPRQEPPPPVPPRPHPLESGTLIVEVVVEGEPNFDYNTVTVTVEGTQEDGTSVSRTLTNRSENIWTEDPFPVGQYTVRAVVTDPPPMNGSVNAVVRGGQTTQVTITLRRDRPTNIAKEFVVHFRFDNAFVEPCMRHVLRKVADYARNHPDEKLLIIGNTDKSGSDDYNLSLGDRRARSVYAYLTFGRDATTRSDALAEWNLLRQPADGQQRTVRDKWGVPQYQYMLQSLGFYPGNIDGQHGPLTNTGVQDFQTSKNLPATGVVNDATWAALIEAYLSQDPQSVPDSQFLRNCGDEPLKWVSCGEQRPRKDTPTDNCAPELAWRPNRRTELVFVRADRLPRPEPKPVTFNLPGTPPVGSGWCVGPDDPNASRCSFLKEGGTNPAPDEWSVEPAEPGSITVIGSIVDENDNPLGNTKYVLIAPDGEFMDGERKCGPERGRPIIGRTAPDGTFSYTKQTPIGVYTMEVDLPPGPHVAHAATKPPATGRGSVVCKRLDSNDSQFDVIVLSGSASQFAVNPVITLASSVVVVKKSYTNPARKLVTLSTDSTFIGSGTFTRSSDAIRFFTAAVGGTEITFNGTDNVFGGAQLTTGVQLFAEGASPSAAMNDVQLTLSLSSADLLVGSPVTATMTSVELTLDICDRRSAPGVDPVPLSTADKINPGRFLAVRDPSHTHERALLIVRPANPAAFTGELVLNPLDSRVQIFRESDEVPALSQTPLTTPQIISNSTIGVDGMKFWAEGVSVSGALRDTGFQLGIKDVENDGDLVSITVRSFSLQVQGATQIPGTNTFVTTRDIAAIVTLIVNITPSPSSVPLNLVTWSPNTTPTADPLRRTVSRATAMDIPVSATVDAFTRSVTIQVVEVRSFAQTAPPNAIFDELSNPDEPVVRVCNVNPASLQVDVEPNTAQVFYTTNPTNVVDLVPQQRTGDGQVTIQPRPLPAGIDIATGRDTRLSVRVVSANGLELQRNNRPGRVRIRQLQEIVVWAYIHVVRNDDGTLATGVTMVDIINRINSALDETNRIWGQACIRFKLRQRPGTLDKDQNYTQADLNIDFIDETDLLDITAIYDPSTASLKISEDRDLFQQGGHDRNAENPTFINIYIIERFVDPSGPSTLGGVGGGNHLIIQRPALGNNNLLAHEIGHCLNLPDLEKISTMTDADRSRRLMRSQTPRGDLLASGGLAGDETTTARRRATDFTG